MNSYKEIDHTENLTLKRSTVIALLVRLELLDIPYVQSRECRNQLVEFLFDILNKDDNESSNASITISIDELEKNVNDIKTAIDILKKYSVG